MDVGTVVTHVNASFLFERLTANALSLQLLMYDYRLTQTA